jgi:hypothetical protein
VLDKASKQTALATAPGHASDSSICVQLQPSWSCPGILQQDHSHSHTSDIQLCLAAVLDYYYNIFASRPGEVKVQWMSARNAWHVKETGSHPCVLHLSGDTKPLFPNYTRVSQPLDTTLPEFKKLAELPVDGEGGVKYVHLVQKAGAYMAHPMIKP